MIKVKIRGSHDTLDCALNEYIQYLYATISKNSDKEIEDDFDEINIITDENKNK